MCKVYNTVGCLTAVKSQLAQYGIIEFKSLNEVIAFQKAYATSRQQMIVASEVAIEKEKVTISTDNMYLKNSIEVTGEAVENELLEELGYLKERLETLLASTQRNALQKGINYFRALSLKKRIRVHESALPWKVNRALQEPLALFKRNEERYNYITTRFEDAVIENCSEALRALERKKAVIDGLNTSIYGAIGEQKVVKELEKLPDEYVLINDFCLSFEPPIYNRNENDHIKSIQVDHLLIAPSGVFLIETKNWSDESLNNLSLRSPVSQLRRTSFALFTVLNNNSSGLGLGLSQHHWGKKKIPLKNLLVLINHKPVEEFQYVKVLSLQQLNSYIQYFPALFTRTETEHIANALISLSRK